MKTTTRSAQQRQGAATSSNHATTKQSSTDPWMLFLVKALLVAVIILMLPKLVDSANRGNKRRKQTERKMSTVREACQYDSEACAGIIVLEEAMNCIHECMSGTCYQEVYATDPLEDGEIDVGRLKGFEQCVKEELRQERIRQREIERQLKRERNGVM